MSSRPTESAPPTRRLFFALWPDANVRVALVQQFTGTALDGAGLEKLYPLARRVPAANLHMTLAFPGQVTATQQACLESAANRVSREPFELEIDYIDSWSGPRVLWSGPTRVPAVLGSLAGELRESLAVCGLQREKQPFRSHITLVRKVNRKAEVIKTAPVYWPVNRFSLVESCTQPSGSIYTVLRTWALEGE